MKQEEYRQKKHGLNIHEILHIIFENKNVSK